MNHSKKYSSVCDYGVDCQFEDHHQSKVKDDEWLRTILNKIAQQNDFSGVEITMSDSSSESSDSDDRVCPLESHTCRVYKCNDPECFSCDLAAECYNCSHCTVNRSLHMPCLDCATVDVHTVAQHQEIRCSYHRKFPQDTPLHFKVSHDPSKVIQSQFLPLKSQPKEAKAPESFLRDGERVAKYLALKKQNKSTNLGESLLAEIVHGTYSQCGIGSDLKPKLDLNMDTSRYEEEKFEVPPEIAKPSLAPRTNSAKLSEEIGAKAEKQVCEVETGQECDPGNVHPFGESSVTGGRPNNLSLCCCFESCDMKPEETSGEDKVPCILCKKYHTTSCQCYKMRKVLDDHKANVNEAFDVLIANHGRSCLDVKCPLRKIAPEDGGHLIWEWFGSLTAIERLNLQCPLNVDGFPLGQPALTFNQQHCPHLERLPDKKSPLSTYVSHFLPRPLKPDVERKDNVRSMKFWDRLNLFDEKLYDHSLATQVSLIQGIDQEVFDDADEEIQGRYDDLYRYWDRNAFLVPSKILVKKPETLVKLIDANELPLKFEALHVLYKSARDSKTLQIGCGQVKVIKPLLHVLDTCDHDGVRRLAIYILALATAHPPGACVFFTLGPQAMTNLYNHYLTHCRKNILMSHQDDQYAMRRAYMMLASNILRDTGACAVFSNAVSFEKTFSNMCDKDPDFQMYLMRTLYYALYDIEGREKILSLPEFRLTPVLSGCLSKKSRVREYALYLLDAVVSVCKQDVLIKNFKDLRGIKIINSILRKGYMTYAHPVVLKMYEKMAEDPTAALAIKEGSLANLIEFVDTVDDPKLIAHTLRVLVKMARDPMTKEVLALTNVITKVAPLLVHTNEELAQSILMIIELMAAKGARNLITQQLVKADPMVDLLWVVGSENRGWDTRVIALRCIIALLNLSPYFGECYIRCKNATNVINLLCHQAKFLTTYSKTLLVQVLSVLAKSKRNYEFLIRNKAIKALVYSFKCFDTFESQLYAHSIGLLAYMMKDRRAVVQFSNVKNSWNLLAKKFMERKFISADILMNLMFLIVNLTDNFELGAKAFLNNGFLKWMIDLVEVYPEMSASIRNAIDSIIANYLPLKFAHHGFLSYQDITNKSLFFATREAFNVYRAKSSFPNFDKGISNKMQPTDAIYYFNLPPSMRSQSMEDTTNAIDIETSENFELYTSISRSAESVQKTVDEEEIFIDLEEDIKLLEIFEQAKLSIARLDEAFQPIDSNQEQLNRINGLAATVVKYLMGFDPTTPVSIRIQEIYLERLQKTLTTNVHPIGRIVVGHKFERAALYKVLADALGIQCWLKRGNGQTASIAWVEVGVTSSPSTIPRQAEELKPNHVVDLMSTEPRLLPIGSLLARQYTKHLDYGYHWIHKKNLNRTRTWTRNFFRPDYQKGSEMVGRKQTIKKPWLPPTLDIGLAVVWSELRPMNVADPWHQVDPHVFVAIVVHDLKKEEFRAITAMPRMMPYYG